MKNLLIWLIIIGSGLTLWFWIIYPAYLEVSKCSLAVRESLQPVINERNKRVYENKLDTCQIEAVALLTLSECYKEKKELNLAHRILVWYPPFLFEQQNLRKQHEAQCLDSSPLFIER